MNFDDARDTVLDHLRKKGKATNAELRRLIGGDADLFGEVREALILDDLAKDKDGVGLLYCGPAAAPTAAPTPVPQPPAVEEQKQVFLSYGRDDAKGLAHKLYGDLKGAGFRVWLDVNEIRSGRPWGEQIRDGLSSSQVMAALISPQSVRTSADPNNPKKDDSVCLDEISFMRYSLKRPIVPVMAVKGCEPPFDLFRLDYVDLRQWETSPDHYQRGIDRLKTAIQAALRGEVRYRSWVRNLTPEDFGEFLNQKRQHFCGREWLFAEIEQWRLTKPERTLLITGDPGVGKSSIVAELVYRNPGGKLLAFHCCMASSRRTLLPAGFIRSLAAMIASQIDEYANVLTTPEMEEALSGKACEQDPCGAFAECILNPLRKLNPPGEGGPRYILIDALDEALALRGKGDTIVDVLASALDHLPDWLRIVATTRNERPVLDRLHKLKPYRLDAHDPRNLEDIDRYIQTRLESPELLERLSAGGHSVPHVRRVLAEKSEGNFLFVQQAIADIENDQYDLANLDAMPPGLRGLYGQFFKRHFPDTASFAPVRRLLEALVAAQEPLTEEQLARATRLDPDTQLPRLLSRLSSYLAERDGRYALYHLSLADWLTSKEQQQGLYGVSRKRGHQRMARFCAAEYRARRAPAAPVAKGRERLSSYVVRYYGLHLERAKGGVQAFRPLVSDGWRRAWEPVDATAAGFLTDVTRAWRAAERGDRKAVQAEQAPPNLGFAVRCALCHASVRSFSRHVPPPLILALVRAGLWTPQQGLACARQLADVGQRADALLLIAPHLPDDVQPEVVQEAMPLARAVLDPAVRRRQIGRVILAMARLIDAEAALTTALGGDDPEASAEFLEALGEAGDVDDVEEALGSVLASPTYRQAFIRVLGTNLLSESWGELAAAVAEQSGSPADLLAAVATWRSAPRTENAWQPEETPAEPALDPAAARAAVSAAQAISDPHERADAVASLVHRVVPAGLVEEMWTAVRDLPAGGSLDVVRAGALAALAPHLPEDRLGDALAVVESLDGAAVRAQVVAALAPRLPRDLLSRALAASQAIGDADEQRRTLMALAPRLPDDRLEQALAWVERLPDPLDQARTLAALAPRLPRRLLAHTRQLAEALPADDVLESPRAIAVGGVAAGVAAREGPRKALDLLMSLPANLRPQALRVAGPRFASQGLLSEFLQAVTGLPEIKDQAEALLGLFTETATLPDLQPFPVELARTVLRTIRQIGDVEPRLATLSAFARRCPTEILPEVLPAVRRFGTENDRVRAMSALTLRLAGEERENVVDATTALLAPVEQAKMLAVLSDPQNPEYAQGQAGALIDPRDRAFALTMLARHCVPARRDAVLEDALAAARSIADPGERAVALAELVSLLPKELPAEDLVPLVGVCARLDSPTRRNRTLHLLAPRLVRLPRELLVRAWQEVLEALGERTRRELLAGVRATLPVLEALGGETAVAEVFQAVEEVAGWWR